MDIRKATLDDLEAIRAIYNQAIAAGFQTVDILPVTMENRRAWFEAHPPEKYPIFVAEIDGQVVGYLSLSAYRPGRLAVRHTAEVSYYLHKDHQRQGIGSALLNYALEQCPTLEIKTLFAILLESNQASYKFLEKFGFEKWGHLPRIADFDGVEMGHFYYGLRVYG